MGSEPEVGDSNNDTLVFLRRHSNQNFAQEDSIIIWFMALEYIIFQDLQIFMVDMSNYFNVETTQGVLYFVWFC